MLAPLRDSARLDGAAREPRSLLVHSVCPPIETRSVGEKNTHTPLPNQQHGHVEAIVRSLYSLYCCLHIECLTIVTGPCQPDVIFFLILKLAVSHALVLVPCSEASRRKKRRGSEHAANRASRQIRSHHLIG